MSFEMAFVFAVLGIALFLFVTERYPIDQVAGAIPVVLLIGGVLSAEEALAGLSSPATVTVAAMLVLGLGLAKTGAVEEIGRWARTAPLGSPMTRLLLLCVVVSVVQSPAGDAVQATPRVVQPPDGGRAAEIRRFPDKGLIETLPTRRSSWPLASMIPGLLTGASR